MKLSQWHCASYNNIEPWLHLSCSENNENCSSKDPSMRHEIRCRAGMRTRPRLRCSNIDGGDEVSALSLQMKEQLRSKYSHHTLHSYDINPSSSYPTFFWFSPLFLLILFIMHEFCQSFLCILFRGLQTYITHEIATSVSPSRVAWKLILQLSKFPMFFYKHLTKHAAL